MEILLLVLIGLLIVFGIIKIVSGGFNKYNSGQGFLTHGATYEFKTKDMQKSTEHIIEKEASKKFQEEESGEDFVKD